MAEESKITNVKDIAEEIGSSVGTNISQSFAKMQSQAASISATEKVLGVEKTREEAVRHNQLLDAIRGIKTEVIIDAEEADSSSWLGFLLKALGLTAAGAAGLAAGLLA